MFRDVSRSRYDWYHRTNWICCPKIFKLFWKIFRSSILVCFFFTIFVSSHMYPENPEGTQVIVGSMNMGYISDTARNRTHNLFRPKREPIPLGHSMLPFSTRDHNFEFIKPIYKNNWLLNKLSNCRDNANPQESWFGPHGREKLSTHLEPYLHVEVSGKAGISPVGYISGRKQASTEVSVWIPLWSLNRNCAPEAPVRHPNSCRFGKSFDPWPTWHVGCIQHGRSCDPVQTIEICL